MLTRLAGGTTPAHVAGCYEGLIDALVIDEADADGADIGRADDRHAHADGRRRGAPARRRGRARGGGGAQVKVAIVGGTGSFGRALAERLVALGYDVVIGSRDAQRAAELGRRLRRRGQGERRRRPRRRPRRPRDQVDARRSTPPASSPTRSGRRPVLCVASDLRFEKDGVLPGRLGTSLAEEVAEILAAPVAAGLQSLAAVHLTQRDAPDQDALICGDDLDAKRIALELADRLVAGRAIDAGPLANARALEGLTADDPQRQQALPRPRGHPRHRARMNVFGVRGAPGDRGRGRPRAADRGGDGARGRRRRRRRAEGRLEGGGPDRPPRRGRALRPRARARRRRRPAPRRGDPARERPDRPAAPAARDRRDRPRLRLRVGRRGRVERARAGHARAAAAGSGRLGGRPARAPPRADRAATWP